MTAINFFSVNCELEISRGDFVLGNFDLDRDFVTHRRQVDDRWGRSVVLNRALRKIVTATRANGELAACQWINKFNTVYRIVK
jgi:hypothetical protein